MNSETETMDLAERADLDAAPGRGWIAEQADLLTEEGLTGHPFNGAYVCVNAPK